MRFFMIKTKKIIYFFNSNSPPNYTALRGNFNFSYSIFVTCITILKQDHCHKNKKSSLMNNYSKNKKLKTNKKRIDLVIKIVKKID